MGFKSISIFILLTVLSVTVLTSNVSLSERGADSPINLTNDPSNSSGVNDSDEVNVGLYGNRGLLDNVLSGLKAVQQTIVNTATDALQSIQRQYNEMSAQIQANITSLSSSLTELRGQLQTATVNRVQSIQAQIRNVTQQLNVALRRRVENELNFVNQTVYRVTGEV